MSSNPPRRFAPTPIEQTTKSSRQPAQEEDDNKKPRRFVPEPVEETTRSSKDTRQQPAEQNEKPKPRRFAPEPVEHTTKSSKDVRTQASDVEEKPKPRRFAPQMVEETHTSSRDKENRDKKGHVKFKPEPISTEYGSNRKIKRGNDSETSSAMDIDEQEEQTPRKFTPILLDTARRSRRAGDSKPAMSQADKTEYAYHLHHSEHWKRVTGERSGPGPADATATATAIADDSTESDFGSAMSTDSASQLREPSPLDGSAPKRTSCLAPKRTHSFRMPDLDTIDSSESERDSNPSPLSASPERDGSPITASDSSYEYFKHATRIRESVDENFTHYLLDLERKKARERLEEQALAAYPNPDFGYEPPDHYINNDDESDEMEIEDRPATWEGHDDDLVEKPPRRDSTGVPWEQLEMQKHAEELQQERNVAKITAKKSESQSPWWKPGAANAEEEISPEMKSMRDRARPPMLGRDIVFPRCPSPEPARFDVTQGSVALRNQMCYLSEAAELEKQRSHEEGGLWHASSTSAKSPVTSVRSPVSAKSTQSKGLWGGFCVDEGDQGPTSGGLAPPPRPTGLKTPKVENPNPFELAFNEGPPAGLQTPPPHGKGPDYAQLNAVLMSEREFEAMMDREYPDSFITQVYNYLSLGYPSLARPFDEELSKISRFSIAELRQDDIKARASPRGYIRLGQDFEGGGGEGMAEDGCMRWQALKRYIREWARQEKNMAKDDGAEGNWGTGARRGSWAI